MRGTERVRLFLYGTLLDPPVLARHSGRRGLMRRAVPALLPRHRRVHLRGTPYPTLLRGAGQVRGVVLEVAGRVLARLSAYEGPCYRLRPLRVLTRRGPCRVWAWVAPSWRAERGPAWEPHTAS
jgi:gamma-glutamylcyclotransferase (GGCT)/AIG2-like uncharacterized protein YtfP